MLVCWCKITPAKESPRLVAGEGYIPKDPVAILFPWCCMALRTLHRCVPVLRQTRCKRRWSYPRRCEGPDTGIYPVEGLRRILLGVDLVTPCDGQIPVPRAPNKRFSSHRNVGKLPALHGSTEIVVKLSLIYGGVVALCPGEIQ